MKRKLDLRNSERKVASEEGGRCSAVSLQLQEQREGSITVVSAG